MRNLVFVALATLVITSCVSNKRVSVVERKLYLVDSIIDSHADDGECDELVNELNEVGYWDLR